MKLDSSSGSWGSFFSSLFQVDLSADETSTRASAPSLAGKCRNRMFRRKISFVLCNCVTLTQMKLKCQKEFV